MLFRPDQSPRPVFPREFSADFVGAIMASDSVSEIIRVADVEVTIRVLKNIDPKHSKWLQR